MLAKLFSVLLLLGPLNLKPIQAKSKFQDSNIINLEQLNEAIKNGPNRKIGFLSQANYESVKGFLDNHTEPMYFGDTQEITVAVSTSLVLAGTVIIILN